MTPIGLTYVEDCFKPALKMQSQMNVDFHMQVDAWPNSYSISNFLGQSQSDFSRCHPRYLLFRACSIDPIAAIPQAPRRRGKSIEIPVCYFLDASLRDGCFSHVPPGTNSHYVPYSYLAPVGAGDLEDAGTRNQEPSQTNRSCNTTVTVQTPR